MQGMSVNCNVLGTMLAAVADPLGTLHGSWCIKESFDHLQQVSVATSLVKADLCCTMCPRKEGHNNRPPPNKICLLGSHLVHQLEQPINDDFKAV